MHDAHSQIQQPPAPERSGSGKDDALAVARTSLLLLSAATRVGLAGSAIAGLWLAVLWAL